MANRDPKFRWFRTYADIVDNTKIRLLAFEDRWHFVALCALKCDGLLDDPQDEYYERKIAIKLGVQVRELDEIKRRLMDVKLIDADYQPVKWEMRQHRKVDLPDGESLDGYKGYVYFISDSNLETVKIGYSKNPWARVKDLQTGRTAKLSVVATLRTTEVSENDIHGIFEDERESGEWFRVSPRIQGLIKAIKAKELPDASAVADYVSNYVATTKETDTDTEVISPKGDKSANADPNDFSFSDFEESWGEVVKECGLPAMRAGARERRRRAFNTRKRQYPDIDDWRIAFTTLRKAKWMHGDNDRGWRCDADDFLDPRKFNRLVEGKYGQAD